MKKKGKSKFGYDGETINIDFPPICEIIRLQKMSNGFLDADENDILDVLRQLSDVNDNNAHDDYHREVKKVKGCYEIETHHFIFRRTNKGINVKMTWLPYPSKYFIRLRDTETGDKNDNEKKSI